MVTEAISAVAAEMPNGFHDAELKSLAVDMHRHVATLEGDAWVAEEGPPEVYRPFRLTLSGLETLLLPKRPEFEGLGELWQRQFPEAPVFDGYADWPPGAEHQSERAAYSFFVSSWNDFIIIQAERAELAWLGPAYDRK